jgi:hypothetical protein
MTFCTCSPSDAVALIKAGYLASTACQPRLAFSFRFLQLYHSLWIQNGLPQLTYLKGLAAFEELHQVLPSAHCVGETREESVSCRVRATLELSFSQSLRHQFALAVHTFRRLLLVERLLKSELLDSQMSSPYASICPACFGPPTARPLDSSAPAEKDIIVAFDACFQQRRLLSASKEYTKEPLPPYFLPQSSLEHWKIRVAGTADLVNAKEVRAQVRQ